LGARNVLAKLPCGGGKTVIMAHKARSHRGASICIAHRHHLVAQMSLALARNGVRHRLIGAQDLARFIVTQHVEKLGRSFYDPQAWVGVASVDTLARRAPDDAWFKQITLWQTDEAHHLLRKNKWGKAVALFPNACGVGWTATPGRADGYGLGRHADGVFDAMVSGPGMRELIAAGYLTDYKLLCPPSDLKLDESDLGESGEFKQAAVSAAVRGSHITGDVVSHYLRYAAGKLGMVFAVDVDHAMQLLAGFQAAGVPAEVITHLTHPTARAAVMRRYERREVLVVINVDLFGEGTDFPALEVVSLARPTASYPLYEQQFCRALRLLEGKAYGLILDHAGNTMRHGGPPDCPRHYSLDRRERRGPHLPADGVPMRTCTACTAPYARTRLTCPYCGADAPEPAGRASPEQVEGDLVLLDGAALAALRGEVARIDGPARVPGHLDGPARIACERRHLERQQAQATLRATIALWGGWRRREGEGDREAQRRFWFRFGVDVATAQTLGAREAGELCSRVAGDLSTAGVVAA
jgi:superfamily II DNA or RNA helicase